MERINAIGLSEHFFWQVLPFHHSKDCWTDSTYRNNHRSEFHHLHRRFVPSQPNTISQDGDQVARRQRRHGAIPESRLHLPPPRTDVVVRISPPHRPPIQPGLPDHLYPLQLLPGFPDLRALLLKAADRPQGVDQILLLLLCPADSAPLLLHPAIHPRILYQQHQRCYWDPEINKVGNPKVNHGPVRNLLFRSNRNSQTSQTSFFILPQIFLNNKML